MDNSNETTFILYGAVERERGNIKDMIEQMNINTVLKASSQIEIREKLYIEWH